MTGFESLIDRFEAVANQQPDDSAVVSPSRATTFSELAASSNRIGRALSKIGGEGPVALLVDDVDSVIASMYGVLRAGRFWVALDPRTPEHRLRQIVGDSGATTYIYEEKYEQVLKSIAAPGASRLSLEAASSEDASRFIARDRSAEDIAAITYTSGSTGSPKGVVQTDGYLLELAKQVSTGNGWTLGPEDRRIFLGSPTFGGPLGGLIGTTTCGATLQPFPVATSSLLKLANWMLEQKTTIYQSVPALFRQLMLAVPRETKFPCVRRVRLGGDVVTREDINLFRTHFDEDCVLDISYSSSECGRIATNEITMTTPVGEIVPVGRPLPGVTIRIIDKKGVDVPHGETGQIIVTKAQMSSRYWNNGNKEERFQSGPDGTRSFRTGDLGRFDENGELYFCGRVDDQLKIRGYRVEPVEIEATLRTHPAVRDAAVIGKTNDSGDVALRGFVTVSSPVVPAELRSHVAKALPDYLVPPLIQILDELPVTSAGKVDRKALGQIERPALPAGESVLPRNTTESALLEIWIEEGGEQYYKVLVAMRTSGSRPKLFLIAGGGGNVVGFHPLVEALGDDQPVYALQSPWLAEDDVGEAGLVEIATHFVEAVRSVQPSGPYLFAGYSSGGVYAYEMAQQMMEQGERVAFLAMLDTASNFGWKRDRLPVRIYRRIAELVRNPGFRLRQYTREYKKRALSTFEKRGNQQLKKALGPDAPRFDRGPQWLPGSTSYHAKPYAGRLTLVRANQKGFYNQGGGPVEDWATLARDGADIVRIDGNHLTMLEEPDVLDLAAAFTKLIDKSIKTSA